MVDIQVYKQIEEKVHNETVTLPLVSVRGCICRLGLVPTS